MEWGWGGGMEDVSQTLEPKKSQGKMDLKQKLSPFLVKDMQSQNTGTLFMGKKIHVWVNLSSSDLCYSRVDCINIRCVHYSSLMYFPLHMDHSLTPVLILSSRQTMNSEVRQAWFTFQHCNLWAVWLQGRHLTSLKLCFLINKKRDNNKPSLEGLLQKKWIR